MKISMLLARKPMEFADQVLRQHPGYAALVLRRYELGDVDRLDLREDFATAWDAAQHVLPPGLRWTVATSERRPIAVGGLEPLGDGHWGCWGLAETLDRRAWAFVRRAAGDVLAFAERELQARQIHALACDTPGALALLARLGFERAGETWEGPDGAAYVPMLRSF